MVTTTRQPQMVIVQQSQAAQQPGQLPMQILEEQHGGNQPQQHG